MNKIPLAGLTAAGMLAFSIAPAFLNAQTIPESTRLPDIDRREVRMELVEKAEQRAAINGLRERVANAEVHRHSITGSPMFVGSHGRFLTGPNGEGGSVRAATARTITASDEHRPVKTFIAENRTLFGHGPDALDRAEKKRDYQDKHNGLRTTVWQQSVDGIPVFEAVLKAHTTANGELVNIGSGWVPDAEASANKGVPGRAALLAKPEISSQQALAIAGEGVGASMKPDEVVQLDVPLGATKRHTLRAPGLNEVWAEYAWLPMDEQNLRLCWQVVFSSKKRGEMFLALIDVESGEMHVRRCLTEYISDATYNVYTSDSPSPFSPGHPTPLTTQPSTVSRTLVTTPALDITASPNGWIDDGVNETRGNNVDAHTDTNADNAPDLPRPQGSPTRVFDYPLDLAQPPSAYRNAAVTQLFYRCNLIHDQLYALGFTEAAGNFQNNNFGRGGAGNDAVQADAQDGSGTNNANFSTPPDGSPGRMQMYVFTGPTPDRDGTLDMEIVIHEYGHGLSNRLVGGGTGISALQTRGMGEGWSDFYALALLSEPGDDVDAVYAKGGYATHQFSGLTQNYYFGIRRYPYSTSLSKNPLTFRDIDPAQANPHTGIPINPIIPTTANEVHNVGEVWCVTLWDARANLIKKHGFAVGNQMMLQLVTDGMKLAPVNPNFLQARDAILQAELVLTGGANRGELWTAFARRGMGSNATSPVSSTTVGLVENYDLPDDLAITPTGATTVTATVGGPFTAATFTLRNTGTVPLNWTAVDNQPWLDVAPGNGTLGAGATVTVTASPNPSANALASGTYQSTITITNTTSGLAQTRGYVIVAEPFSNVILAEDFESGTLNPARWATSGTSTWRTQVTTANAPHGGLRHLTLDSSGSGVYARNEATLTVNLAGRSDITLSFWAKSFADEPNGPPAYPFISGADFDGVAISANGTTWYEARPLRTLTAAWVKYTVDLDAAIAAAGISYSSAFKIRFNQYDNFPIATDGIAIDDISIAETFDRRITLNVPAAINENAAPASATVTIAPAASSSVTINLTSSSPGSLGVPASVTIPAGQTSIGFNLAPVDDVLLNGTRSVAISATAPTFIPATRTVALQDNEIAILSLNIPANSVEGAGTVNGTVLIDSAPAVDVAVSLSSGAPADVSVPPFVTIPAGQTSATFPVTIVDDSRIDGPVTVAIDARVANWTTGSASITVADNENTDLIVVLPPSLREGDSPVTASVRISGTRPVDLNVSLGSSDTTEITVPAAVVIPAGQTTANFTVTPVNDSEADGTQNVTVSATAPGFAGGSAAVAVQDNDAHHFTVGPIPSSVLRNDPVAITVTAKDINDATITNFNQAVGFGAADSGATVIPVTPAGGSGFVNGVLSANVTFGAYGTGVVLTVADTGGHQGTSNSFDVVLGPLAKFEWNAITSPKFVDAPFPVTIRATDAAGNPVTTYTGTPTLSAPVADSLQILTWTAFADISPSGEYENTKKAIRAHVPNFTESSTTTTSPVELAAQLVGKQVFLVVEQEGASDVTLGTIGSSWASVLANFVNNGGTVIVCSHARAEHLLLANSGLLSATSNSILDSANVTKTTDTPLNAGVTTPFNASWVHSYSSTNGAISLQVATGQPIVLSRDIGTGRAVLIGTDYFTIGTGMDRVIGNAVALAQTAAPGTGLPVSPSIAGPFVGGQWSGNVSLPFVGASIRLRASDGPASGDSNLFSVGTATLPGNAETIFAEDFESGSLNPAFWTSTGTGTFRTQVTTQFSPHGGTRHMTMDNGTDSGAYTRNEATLTVNLAGRTGVKLRFWAAGYGDEPNGPPPAPFIGGADFDGVAMSADGNTWWEIQALRSLPSAYGEFLVDLDAAIAARGISYNSNFKIRFNQFDDFALTTDGIVVDDILISGFVPPNGLTINLPAQVNEGTGPVAGSISVSPAPVTDLVISLSSKSPSKVTVPATVTIPAGQTSAAFSITVLDDTFVDGPKHVIITGAATGFLETGVAVQIADNDGGTLTLGFPSTVAENAGVVTGSLTFSSPSLVPVIVSLSSNNPAALNVPATITVPAGAMSANVSVTVVDDLFIDGDQSVQITASLPGWAGGSDSLVVVDNEARILNVSIPASVRETDAPKVGFVSLNGLLATDVVIALSSSDTSEVTVPPNVTILAGQSVASFAMTVVDDLEADGAQPITITASSPTLTSGSSDGSVRDNEAHHFTFAPIGNPEVRNGPIPAIITAHEPSGAILTDYDSVVTLRANSNIGLLTVTPSNGSGFVNGRWNGSVQIDALATGVILTADDGLGHTGSSNAFDLVDGQISRFVWDPIGTTQTVDNPFPVTIRAVDAGGATATGYNGVATLAIQAPSETPTIGAGGSSANMPFYTILADSRTNVLYRAQEIGGPLTITGLSLNVTARDLASQTLTNWTIRMKHVVQPTLSNMGSWDNAGWTTVYRASPVIDANGWVTFHFTTPFNYDGGRNLLIDFSMDRSGPSGNTNVQASATVDPLVRYWGSDNAHGDPLLWTAAPFPQAHLFRPDIRFSSVKEIAMRPALTGAFTSGVWTGQISVPIPGIDVSLTARAGAIVGGSNPINVQFVLSPGTEGIVFAEDFESGILNPSHWTISGTGPFRSINTSSNGPRGTRHLTMDSTLSAFARNEATVTLNLTGRTAVFLRFWAKEFSDSPHGPPPIPFPGTGANFDGVAISGDGGLNWYEVHSLRTLTSGYAQYTVDLDAAIAARGLTYGSNFKIRFNQYDNGAIPSRGIAIDDIRVTANAIDGFVFNVPAQVREGDGIVAASVTLDAAASTDTVIALASSATAKILVPPSVTIPAGQTSAPFSLSILDDDITDGHRTVYISGSTGSSLPRVGVVRVLDNDPLSFQVAAPLTVVEGSASQTGVITIADAASGYIIVNLSSNDTTELTVPNTVEIQPGQRSVTFPITIIDDPAIDGTQLAVITASVSGWGSVAGTVQVTDNELRNITVSGFSSVYEGQPSTGTISINGTLPADLVVTLTSGDPAQFTVPPAVIIPAGQTTASVIGAAVDDAQTDGTRAVSINASAPTFVTGSGLVSIFDNDVHHFTFSNITSPKLTGVPFSVTVTARDINEVTITPFNGQVTLGAAGDGGPVAMTPSNSEAFSLGSWTGNVTCNAAQNSVRLRATSGLVTSTSNAFNLQPSPAISISPPSINANVAQGGSTAPNFVIRNTGGGTLTWSIASSAAMAEVVSEGPEFGGSLPVPKQSESAKVTARDPSRIYEEPAVAGEIVEPIASIPLTTILANLNSNNTFIRNAIPTRYAFSEGVTGTNIGDGGNDMYDGGNFLNTNLSLNLPYSDNLIVNSAALGNGGRYFTRKYDGLWVFGADVSALNYFEITGDLGADSGGAMDSAVLSVVRDGITYRGFVKRVYNAGDPSVNHLIILANNGSATHEVSTDTNNDYHRVTSLSGVTRIYYLLYAGTGGAYISNASTLNIMTAFLDAVSAPDWLMASPLSGNVSAGGSQNVQLTLNAAGLGVGTYNRTLIIASNDPAVPQANLPVTLTVTPAANLTVSPASGYSASGLRGGPFAPVSQVYTLTNTGGQPMNWSVTKSASWLNLFPSTGSLLPGASVAVTVGIDPSAIDLKSGNYSGTLTFRNNTNGIGDTTRPATLTINPYAELAVTPGILNSNGPYGGPFVPPSRAYTITNVGDAPMAWSVTKTGPWITFAPGSGTLNPGASTSILVTVSGSTMEVGRYDESISFNNTTNGRGTTTKPISLDVFLPAPTLQAEPPTTPANSNTISWNPVFGANAYEAQVSVDPSFGNPASSGTIAGTNYTFTGLSEGVLYYYRVRARRTTGAQVIVVSDWSNVVFSSQFNLPPNIAAIEDQVIVEDRLTHVVQFEVADDSTPANDLILSLEYSNPVLFPPGSVTLGGSGPNRSIQMAPAANEHGRATITISVADGGGKMTAETFSVQVLPVNDAPAFVGGLNQMVLEDSLVHAVDGWAREIRPGPANESSQTVAFVVTTNRPEIFENQPTITSDGMLSFTPAANANGVATASVRLRDNGGTANDGVDISVALEFTIEVRAVNDVPSFAAGANQAVRQDAEAQSVPGWATQVSKGPADEEAQTVEFLVTTNRPEMFSVLPAVSPNGTLTYTPADDASGTAAVTVRIRDNGGTASGGMDTSEPQVFTITSTYANDAPSFVIGSNLEVGNDAGAQTYPSWATQIKAGPADEAGQLLDFRLTVDNSSLFAALPVLAADGTLSFTPAPGASGIATVLVQLHDNGGTENGGADLSEVKAFKIAVTTFIEEAGRYNGLVQLAEGVHPNADYLGVIQAMADLRGALSGKITIGGRTKAFKGHIDASGIARFSPNDAASLEINRPGKATLHTEFKIDVTNDTDSLTGTVREGNAVVGKILAGRSLYTDDPDALPPYSSVPADLQGAYTVVFENTNSVDTSLPAETYPRSDSSGALSVSKSGRVRMNAWLSDGVRISYGNDLTKGNVWPLYYGSRRGYAMSGFLNFRDIPQASDVDGAGIMWFRPAGAGAFYPGGWPGGLLMDLTGSKFRKPVRGAYVFEGLSPADRDGNAVVTLQGGGLPAILNQPVNIMPDSSVRIIAPNSSRMHLRIDGKTGLFRGSLERSENGPSNKVRGALLQKQSRGSGSFKARTSAGGVLVTPN
jgi:hypothetical protein